LRKRKGKSGRRCLQHREIAGKEERKRAREREEGRGKERQTQKVAGREDAAEDQTGDGKEE
jgi:hypothetical protein